MWIKTIKDKTESIKYIEETIDRTLQKIYQRGIFNEMTRVTNITKTK